MPQRQIDLTTSYAVVEDANAVVVQIAGSGFSAEIQAIIVANPGSVVPTEAMWSPVQAVSAAGLYTTGPINGFLRVKVLSGTITYAAGNVIGQSDAIAETPLSMSVATTTVVDCLGYKTAVLQVSGASNDLEGSMDGTTWSTIKAGIAGLYTASALPRYIRVTGTGTVKVALYRGAVSVGSTTVTTGGVTSLAAGSSYLTVSGPTGAVSVDLSLEALMDWLAGSFLVAGSNVTLTYDDVNNKITIASTASGGSSPTSALTFSKDTLTATSDGQTVFNTGVTQAPTAHLAFAVKIGGELHLVDFTHTAPAGVNTITLTNGLSAPIDSTVVVYYLAR